MTSAFIKAWQAQLLKESLDVLPWWYWQQDADDHQRRLAWFAQQAAVSSPVLPTAPPVVRVAQPKYSSPLLFPIDYRVNAALVALRAEVYPKVSVRSKFRWHTRSIRDLSASVDHDQREYDALPWYKRWFSFGRRSKLKQDRKCLLFHRLSLVAKLQQKDLRTAAEDRELVEQRTEIENELPQVNKRRFQRVSDDMGRRDEVEGEISAKDALRAEVLTQVLSRQLATYHASLSETLGHDKLVSKLSPSNKLYGELEKKRIELRSGVASAIDTVMADLGVANAVLDKEALKRAVQSAQFSLFDHVALYHDFVVRCRWAIEEMTVHATAFLLGEGPEKELPKSARRFAGDLETALHKTLGFMADSPTPPGIDLSVAVQAACRNTLEQLSRLGAGVVDVEVNNAVRDYQVFLTLCTVEVAQLRERVLPRLRAVASGTSPDLASLRAEFLSPVIDLFTRIMESKQAWFEGVAKDSTHPVIGQLSVLLGQAFQEAVTTLDSLNDDLHHGYDSAPSLNTLSRPVAVEDAPTERDEGRFSMTPPSADSSSPMGSVGDGSHDMSDDGLPDSASTCSDDPSEVPYTDIFMSFDLGSIPSVDRRDAIEILLLELQKLHNLLRAARMGYQRTTMEVVSRYASCGSNYAAWRACVLADPDYQVARLKLTGLADFLRLVCHPNQQGRGLKQGMEHYSSALLSLHAYPELSECAVYVFDRAVTLSKFPLALERSFPKDLYFYHPPEGADIEAAPRFDLYADSAVYYGEQPESDSQTLWNGEQERSFGFEVSRFEDESFKPTFGEKSSGCRSILGVIDRYRQGHDSTHPTCDSVIAALLLQERAYYYDREVGIEKIVSSVSRCVDEVTGRQASERKAEEEAAAREASERRAEEEAAAREVSDRRAEEEAAARQAEAAERAALERENAQLRAHFAKIAAQKGVTVEALMDSLGMEVPGYTDSTANTGDAAQSSATATCAVGVFGSQRVGRSSGDEVTTAVDEALPASGTQSGTADTPAMTG